eukprot:CAMPEP_0203676236 /NCGR_PEP_ID=MMETSP0090-20130426/23973_1 /ASSEMBLY_ACC=CAM_ASM_001088 /TAXON_ID=426623 /ORGANISM="Chaetoceros affinis, Strain CCMP159" /LENGTH=531 /DNA_ID=CAMNT_0050542731 /DNA_START=833 /DNA_END=2428 /DNA_ORIENTATION=-
MALSHLPMPKDEQLYKVDTYNFEGMRLGNVHTCTAQGFTQSTAMIATCGYNAMLCVYYACTIGFNAREETLMHIERIIHTFPILLGIAGSIMPLFYDLYNPTPWEAWCFVDPVPYNCYSGCQRGSAVLKTFGKILPPALIFFHFVVIFISLTIVCHKVYTVQRHMAIPARDGNLSGGHINNGNENGSGSSHNRNARSQGGRTCSGDSAAAIAPESIMDDNHDNDNDNDNVNVISFNTNINNNNNSDNRGTERNVQVNSRRFQMLEDRHRITKVVLLQSMSYIFAQVLTLLFPFIINTFGINHPIIAKVRLVAQPLQGFYNLIIFITFKVYHILHADRSMTILGAIKEVFFQGWWNGQASRVDPNVHGNGNGIGINNNNSVNRRSGHLNESRYSLHTIDGFNAADISIELIRTSQDELGGFQVGSEFISYEEYLEHAETVSDNNNNNHNNDENNNNSNKSDKDGKNDITDGSSGSTGNDNGSIQETNSCTWSDDDIGGKSNRGNFELSSKFSLEDELKDAFSMSTDEEKGKH